ncbi:putative transcription factor GLK2 [Panicum miliaceum]|uniref:Transcription factor GLK2 n=1 Tax=Panicum miliaceum TaxID=4540 RepID=A0A3L6QXL8_PANMI|nr:putative transcription factor GLK2 [Panicum miliaceum]
MASSPSDLTLDYKPANGNGGGGAYAVIPKQQEPLVDGHHLTTEQTTQKLREFLARLEEERLKIDAFKRELPLCMHLLNHAMEAYRQQLEAYQLGSLQGAPARPLVLEEFIPLKNIGIDAAGDKMGNPPSEKASWMESAQLWNGPGAAVAAADTAAKGPQTPKESSEHPLPIDTLGALDAAAGERNGGAFLPFGKDKAAAEGAALPELALAPSEKDAAEADRKPYLDAAGANGGLGARRDLQNGAKPASNAPDGQPPPPPPQTHRKARRCWSPELHRRFVNALQILGGAQVATPKQIRELMKVDGLTNDEVKSHLQKYRLHTRRPMPTPPAPATAAPQLVVLGGIWVPPEYATQAAGQAIYGAHPATQPHYTAAVAAAQEYYPPPAAVHHLQHHPAAMVHRAAAPPPPAAYKAAMAGSPPESSEGRGSAGGGSVGVGGGRERSESIEEEEGEDREDDDDDDDDVPAAKADGEESAGAAAIKY